jgi:excisionase family DNA binding protein
MTRESIEKTVLLLRVSEAARQLSISRSRAYELVSAGVIPSVRLGASVRVPALALERFVKLLEEKADVA